MLQLVFAFGFVLRLISSGSAGPGVELGDDGLNRVFQFLLLGFHFRGLSGLSIRVQPDRDFKNLQ